MTSVCDWIIGLIGIVGWWWCGWWVVQAVIGKDNTCLNDEKITLSMYISSLGIPWLLTLLNQAYHLEINPGNIWRLIAGIAVIGLIGKIREIIKAWKDKQLLGIDWKREEWMTAGVLMIAGLVMSYLLLFYNQTLVGADSDGYLFESARVIRTGNVNQGFDRSVVLILPVVISSLIPVSVEVGIKMMAVGLFVMLGWNVSLLVREVVGKRWAVLALIMGYLCQSGWRLVSGIYANMLGVGLTILVFWIMILSFRRKSRKKVGWLGLMSFFWGVMFNIHGIMSYGSLVIIGVPVVGVVMLKWRQLWKRKRHLLVGVLLCGSVFLLASYPLLIKGWKSFVRGAVNPLLIRGKYELQRTFIDGTLSTTNRELMNNSSVLSPGVSPEIPSFLDFPLRNEAYIKYYEVSWLVLAVVGWLVVVGNQSKCVRNKRVIRWVIVSGSLITFLLTQQEYFGLKWYGDRFVMSSFVWIVLFGLIGMEQLEKIVLKVVLPVKWKCRGRVWIWVILIFLPAAFSLQDLIQNEFKQSIDTDEYNFYKLAGRMITDNEVVYSTSMKPRWLPGLNPQAKVMLISNEAICGNETIRKKLGEANWRLGQAFSNMVDTEESRLILSEASGEQNYSILLDMRNSCINPTLFIEGYHTELEDQQLKIIRPIARKGTKI